MATSGSTDFELDVSDYIEEAFERCGLEVRTGYDLKTARRSMNLMLAEWANRGLNQWTIVERTQALTDGTATYSLGTDVIDILSAVVRRSSTDFALERISRDAYQKHRGPSFAVLPRSSDHAFVETLAHSGKQHGCCVL